MSSHRRASRANAPAASDEHEVPDFGVLLTVALEAFKTRLHAQLAKAGYDDLGPSFGFVFRSLADRPLSLTELAERLGISSQGALKIAAEMVDRGYVERRGDPADARVRRLALTTRGRNALREARRFHASTEKQLVAALGTDSVAATRAVLDTLVAGAEPDAARWAGSPRPF